VQEANEGAADAHGDFDRRGVAVGNDTNSCHVADRDTFERHGCPAFDSCGILEVGAKHQFVREHSSGRGRHQEDEQDKNGNGREDQGANSKLRPLNLFAAGQGIPLDEFSLILLDALSIAEGARLTERKSGAFVSHRQ
jgi:hypothetical protein